MAADRSSNRPDDPLIDDIRAIRRALCEEFDNDVDRLGSALREIERAYLDRAGPFALQHGGAQRVVDRWEQIDRDAPDVLVDEVRELRKGPPR